MIQESRLLAGIFFALMPDVQGNSKTRIRFYNRLTNFVFTCTT